MLKDGLAKYLTLYHCFVIFLQAKYEFAFSYDSKKKFHFVILVIFIILLQKVSIWITTERLLIILVTSEFNSLHVYV